MISRHHSTPGPNAKSHAGAFTLSRERFARISAVEGIVLTPDMREMMRRFDRDGLSASECRRAIIRQFKPSS